ncbi:MAG: sugar ABC transporter permease [Spirochaetia bacterium]
MSKKIRVRYDLKGLFFLAPALVFLALSIAFPLFRVFQRSFQEYSAEFGSFVSVDFDQYRKLFADPLFWTSLKNTFLFTGGSILLHLGISYPIALLLSLNWPSKRTRNVFRGSLISPFLFSAPAAALLWGLLFRPLGPLNYLIESIFGTTVAFLGDTRWALISVLIVNGWKSFPLYMVLILGGLQSIPVSLYDAARVDGANWFQTVLKVTIPMMRTLTMTIVLIDFATTFIHFDLVWIMTKGGPMRSTYLMSFFLYEKGLKVFKLGYGSAVGVVVAVIMTFCIAAYLLIYSRGEELKA